VTGAAGNGPMNLDKPDARREVLYRVFTTHQENEGERLCSDRFFTHASSWQ
jgi:hypothetical protein